MIYDDLHQRFGNHIAKRVQTELTRNEFAQVDADELPDYLDLRAEAAQKEYQNYLSDPFGNAKSDIERKKQIDTLYQRWREAEDLAYLITVAQDVSHNVQLMAVAGGR